MFRLDSKEGRTFVVHRRRFAKTSTRQKSSSAFGVFVSPPRHRPLDQQEHHRRRVEEGKGMAWDGTP